MRILLAEYKRYCHVNRNCLLSFPILCGVDVSYETLTVNPALCYRFLKFSLRQVIPDVIQPLALRTFTPPLPPHPYHHHSLAHTCFFSSQYITIPLQTTFLHFLGYFSHLCYHTNSFIPYSIQLGNSAHPFPQHFVISLLPMYILVLPEFSLLHTYPVLSLHNYLAVPSLYCASILIDDALYRTPFLDL